MDIMRQSATSPSGSNDAVTSWTEGYEKMGEQVSVARRDSCDVLVIGGGPAGSTVAPMLAEKGYKVVILEKARHPRFHIGESLLPSNLPLFERMGIAADVKVIGMEKWAAEFVSPHHDQAREFHFGDAWDKSMPYAYQVRRAEFDEILIRNAARKGVEVFEGCKARSVEFLENDSIVVLAEHDDGRQIEWQSRFLVDASGRDTFLANRFQIKQRNPRHNSSAVYGHFSGARRHDGRAEGNISIFWFEHGWFWFIPMLNDTTSVGMVTWPYFMKSKGERSLEEFLMDGVAMCPALAERLEEAQLLTDVEATGNFSYVSERNHGKNYVMLGDAYAFIDPVFSSGVLLAMNSGVIAAEAIDTCLANPGSAKAALKRFDKLMKHGPKEFSWFIYRVTNPIMRDFLMNPKNVFRVKEAILSVLAGDIFGKTPIWRSIRIFKGLYYLANMIQPKRAYFGWKRRRFNIRKVDEAVQYNA
jgi:flavin-dependent dehydrogenase